MRCKLFILTSLLFLTNKAFSQNEVPIDLINVVEQTFIVNPLIKRNALTITERSGNVQIQKSIFDFMLTSSLSVGQNKSYLFEQDTRNDLVDGILDERNTVANVGLSKRFRSGVIIDWTNSYRFLSDNLPINSFGENEPLFISNHGITSMLSVTQPLLKGRSKIVATALEKAAVYELESTKREVDFNNSLILSKAVEAYWEYVVAYHSLNIFQENEDRIRNILSITEELVLANRKPKADLIQIKADLANQERLTFIANQNYLNTKLYLGRTIGWEEEECKRIGKPLDEFPIVIESGYLNPLGSNTYIKLAKNNRSDLVANKELEEAFSLKQVWTKNQIKPQLDLGAYIGYGGNQVGNGLNNFFKSFSPYDGGNVEVGITLKMSYSLNNNHAKGAYLQSKVALENQQIITDNLNRNIELDVSVAVNNLNNSVLVLEKAQQSYLFYQEVFDNEKVKFQRGITTLLNLTLFQERLTASQLELLRAKQQFATSITQLRYETGSLYLGGSNNGYLKYDNSIFYTLPILD